MQSMVLLWLTAWKSRLLPLNSGNFILFIKTITQVVPATDMESPAAVLQHTFYLDQLFTEEVKLRCFEDRIQRLDPQDTHTESCLSFKEDLNYTLLRGFEEKAGKARVASGEMYGFRFNQSMGHPPANSYYLNVQEELLKWHNLLKKKLNQRGFHQLYKAERKLGKGYSAVVYQGLNQADGQRYAVKAFTKKQLSNEPSKLICLKNEIKFLRMLSHKNVITLHQIFQTDSTIYLILQLLKGGTIHDHLATTTFPLQDIQTILRSLLQGAEYLHSKSVIHRDLKPANLILRENREVVIADFGLATTTHEELHSFYRCGTPGYAAPEIINSKAGETQSTVSDIFSVGSVAYTLAFKKSAFKGTTPKEIINANRRGEIDFNHYICSRINPLLLDLIKKMMDTNPSTRITAKQALQHPFITTKDIGNVSAISTPMFGSANATGTPHFTFSYDQVKVDTPISMGPPNYRYMKSIITAKNEPKTPITPNSPVTPISMENMGSVESPKPPRKKGESKFSLHLTKANDKFLTE